MLADNPNVNEEKPQPLKLKFNFYTQRGKLIIEAQNQDNQLYIGAIDPHPMIHFDTIKELIFGGKVKIISKNEDALRIRIGTTSLELISKARINANQLSEKLKQSNAKQKEMQGMIELQKNEIAELKQSAIDLTNTVMELKKVTQTLVSENQQLKKQIKDINLKLVDNLAYSCKNQQKLINLEKQSKKQQLQIKDIKQILIKEQTKEQININKQKLFGGVGQRPLFGPGSIFGSQEKSKLNATDLFEKSNLQNNASNNMLSLFNNINKKQQENPSCSELFGRPKNGLFRKSNQIVEKKTQTDPSFKWSQTLKSNKITINQNTITLSTQSDYGEICLTGAAFSHSSKVQTSWVIKIKKKADFISLGICLKSAIEKHNFSSQKMSWLQIGHGQYSVNSQGLSLNHSNKSFNNQKGSFIINQDDVITVEYDPVKQKLGFSKNKSSIFFEYFEMPIILPPQNDDYHPFVLMRGQGECVELIHPA